MHLPRRVGLSLVLATALVPAAARAESGSAVNLHVEPGAAVPFNDPYGTPVGQGVSAKVDIPVWQRLAIQAVGDVVSFRSGPYLNPGTALGGGVGARYRILDDKQGYLLHLGGEPEGHQGNLFGNLWVDANFLLLGGSGEARPAFSVGAGVEASLVDGLQIGPFAKYTYVGPEQMALFGLSLSVGIPDTTVHETDYDHDGIVNSKDKCPRDPEDKDGFEDDDGCPEYDNDKDGLADSVDQCPNAPEDKDGFQDEDGCPDPDNDQDGVADTVDRCPLQPEDKDGFQDEDGCPDEDNDQDGIPDTVDRCPNAPEDKDGFEDEDGCPDPDNDRDGIADLQDKCPDQPETRNGIDDEDGCPEEKAKVYVEDKKVVVSEKIFFQFNKAQILSRSFGLLDNVAQVLTKFPQIQKLQIEGHTDDVGDAAYNQKLSEQRAQAVLEYLVKKGVARERLTAVGFGKSRPLAEGRNEAARERNRRVEFNILEPANGIVPVVVDPNAPPEAAPAAPRQTEPERTAPSQDAVSPDAGAP